MKICYVAAEMFPLAKTGGLADVAGALPRYLKRFGHDVQIFLPGYLQIDRKILDELPVSIELIEDECFRRDQFYGYPDDGKRFEVFCRAVLARMTAAHQLPDIVWCNDWHTGLIPLLLRERQFENIKTVFTIHNLAYQGGWNGVNFMESGIVNADLVTTVSPTYAREIQTPEFACGLGEQLRQHEIIGILNGIDVTTYDPDNDEDLFANYNSNDLSGKKINRAYLQRECGFLENDEFLLVGMISRLTEQKGFDLLASVLEKALKEMPLQLVILGNGEIKYEKFFEELAQRYPQQLCFFCKFDEKAARKIYAGSDAFLMPSRFEPCGLGQLLALRYGSIPLVHSVGGLRDTIIDGVNGFAFSEYTQNSLYNGICRVMAAFGERQGWRKMQQKALRSDFSWEHSARLYERLLVDILKIPNNQ